MTVGKQIRKYRKLKAWNLRELGERANLAISTLSEIENNQAPGSVKALTKIAETLGVDLDYLFKQE